MKIAICGFMGSGKSTLIDKLRAEIECADLDELICEELKAHSFASIAEFVEARNWDAFREIESKVLANYLKNKENFALALGGGSTSPVNKELLRAHSVQLFWLDVDFETCWQRINGDAKRPLVKKGRNELQKLYNDRLSQYKTDSIALNPDAVKSLQDIETLIKSK